MIRNDAQRVGASCVCSMTYALRFSTAACVMAGVESFIGDLGGSLGGVSKGNSYTNNTRSTSPNADVVKAVEEMSTEKVESQATTCMFLLEALLGCSQINMCRDYFAGESPWKTNAAFEKKDFFGKDSTSKKGNMAHMASEQEEQDKSTGIAIVIGAIEVLGPRTLPGKGLQDIPTELRSLLPAARSEDASIEQSALAPDAAPTGLAVLLNACLDTTGART